MWGLTECGARPRENNEGEESGDITVELGNEGPGLNSQFHTPG